MDLEDLSDKPTYVQMDSKGYAVNRSRFTVEQTLLRSQLRPRFYALRTHSAYKARRGKRRHQKEKD